MGGLPALAVQGKGGQAAHGTRALDTRGSVIAPGLKSRRPPGTLTSWLAGTPVARRAYHSGIPLPT